jgi:hypothetical protein
LIEQRSEDTCGDERTVGRGTQRSSTALISSNPSPSEFSAKRFVIASPTAGCCSAAFALCKKSRGVRYPNLTSHTTSTSPAVYWFTRVMQPPEISRKCLSTTLAAIDLTSIQMFVASGFRVKSHVGLVGLRTGRQGSKSTLITLQDEEKSHKRAGDREILFPRVQVLDYLNSLATAGNRAIEKNSPSSHDFLSSFLPPLSSQLNESTSNPVNFVGKFVSNRT